MMWLNGINSFDNIPVKILIASWSGKRARIHPSIGHVDECHQLSQCHLRRIVQSICLLNLVHHKSVKEFINGFDSFGRHFTIVGFIKKDTNNTDISIRIFDILDSQILVFNSPEASISIRILMYNMHFEISEFSIDSVLGLSVEMQLLCVIRGVAFTFVIRCFTRNEVIWSRKPCR